MTEPEYAFIILSAFIALALTHSWGLQNETENDAIPSRAA
jgi:hypothetical protein